jgi:hypothetical protein
MESIPNITFITFGNSLYYSSLERLKKEVSAFPFTTTIFYKDTDLMEMNDFWGKHREFITQNKRGYGYWIWKSYLTLHTLKNMKENEILFYMDAGCSLLDSGMGRFLEYIQTLENSKSGMLSFRMTYKQKSWTKMDIFKALEIDEKQKEYGQLVGGIFFIKKSEKNLKIVEEWYNTCCNYHLLNDECSVIPNDATFNENRHDQSIWSVIRYKYDTEIIAETRECGPEGVTSASHSNTKNNPIHANRLQ